MNARVLACILATGLATLACSIFVGGPAYPEPAVISGSTQSAQDAEAEIDRAIADSAQTGSFRLALTESQLTAYVAARLRQQPSPLISDPQIVLREGEITLYGKAQSGILVATVSVHAQVMV